MQGLCALTDAESQPHTLTSCWLFHRRGLIWARSAGSWHKRSRSDLERGRVHGWSGWSTLGLAKRGAWAGEGAGFGAGPGLTPCFSQPGSCRKCTLPFASGQQVGAFPTGVFLSATFSCWPRLCLQPISRWAQGVPASAGSFQGWLHIPGRRNMTHSEGLMPVIKHL